MILRRITMYAKNTDQVSPVRKFVEGIYLHPMYTDVVSQLILADGFIAKTNRMEETKEYTKFVSEVQFSDKDTFDRYFNDPSVESLYNYLETLIISEDVEFNKEVIES